MVDNQAELMLIRSAEHDREHGTVEKLGEHGLPR